MNKVCFMKVTDKQDGFSNQSLTRCTNLNLFYSTLFFYSTKFFLKKNNEWGEKTRFLWGAEARGDYGYCSLGDRGERREGVLFTDNEFLVLVGDVTLDVTLGDTKHHSWVHFNKHMCHSVCVCARARTCVPSPYRWDWPGCTAPRQCPRPPPASSSAPPGRRPEAAGGSSAAGTCRQGAAEGQKGQVLAGKNRRHTLFSCTHAKSRRSKHVQSKKKNSRSQDSPGDHQRVLLKLI